jgi:hypothetical protein
MKGLYLTLLTLSSLSSQGYNTKIYGQVDAFRKAGIAMHIISLGNEKTVILTKHSYRSRDAVVILSRFKKYFWNNRIKLFSAALQFIKIEKPEVLYIRYPFSDPIYIGFLHKLRQVAADTVILSEIPTFPYVHDIKLTIRGRITLLVDRICRQLLKNYIDRIVSVDYEDKIFDIKTISIQNGVNVDMFTPVSSSCFPKQALRLIGVANLQDYHGYDRVVSAIKKWVKLHDRDIVFHIVSPPTIALAKLRNVVEKNKLNKYIIFHGRKTGEDLNDIFNKCNIAVGTLAWHRINVTQASPLKSREYMARGIPFIYASKDQGIASSLPYALQVPSNDDPVGLDNVLEFLKISLSNPERCNQMRKYAKKKWDWSSVMKPVIKEIKKISIDRKNQSMGSL